MYLHHFDGDISIFLDSFIILFLALILRRPKGFSVAMEMTHRKTSNNTCHVHNCAHARTTYMSSDYRKCVIVSPEFTLK